MSKSKHSEELITAKLGLVTRRHLKTFSGTPKIDDRIVYLNVYIDRGPGDLIGKNVIVEIRINDFVALLPNDFKANLRDTLITDGLKDEFRKDTTP